MSLIADVHRPAAEAIARLSTVNPFGPERRALEDTILGTVGGTSATKHAGSARQEALEQATVELVEHWRDRLHRGVVDVASVSAEERRLYKEGALVALFDESALALDEVAAREQLGRHKVAAYQAHRQRWAHFFDVVTGDLGPNRLLATSETPAHLFALFFQLRRAFLSMDRHLIGASTPMVQLRAAVWRSVFTADPARYRRALIARMREVPTLILGETGTGKELVARAIAGAAYIAFDDEQQRFVGDHTAFFPISLAELPETLVESALFGHKKGAFTGANDDHKGVFAECPAEGTVFLDEVGELPPAVQVKLLRVLESREASPLGSHQRFRFAGRLLAATHRDLAAASDPRRQEGVPFRLDLFHRLAGDVITTPPLRDRVRDDVDELARLAHHLCRTLVGDDEAAGLFADVQQVLARRPADHPWPGNVRELAQLVRRVLVQGADGLGDDDVDRVSDRVSQGALHGEDDRQRAINAGTAPLDDVVTAYVRQVYARVGSVSGTARQLGVDRRTVRVRLAEMADLVDDPVA